ncbi:hypothetical protein EDE08_103106 [Bradyrhizobium sp. R2.2-H]|jgi:hypothetical protein|uniref:hypothetical protein n=1 Tax=unclassified Bradyrhizobium TaxID=2631580 RepID=UPI0010EFE186|nr:MULTISPECIES: hypothetical protein [unclassified Bradyrhizobium]TCU74891.1 hypothetical protein EDE10_103105 [Bradyrhizobium sp. Y-H1]TCU77659.1 hypothetical protein EDE08_103106 [Bradyrhizobium sp. R2.2-H]
MTAFKDLRRHPAAPVQRSSNRAPGRFNADAWPGFAGGPFGSAVRGASGDKPAKPHLR